MKTKLNKKIKKLFYGQNFYAHKQSSIWNLMPEIFLVCIFALLLVVSALFFSNHKYYQVNQTSMQPLFNNYQNPNIKDGVFVLVNSKVEVGDIIVVKFGESSIIKRLLATGGDKIAIVEDANTQEYFVQRIKKGATAPYTLQEPYVKNPLNMQIVYNSFQNLLENNPNAQTINGVTYLALQEDEIFYLGDNRGQSYDSSNYGPGKLDHVVGKVDVVIWQEQNVLFHILQYVFGFKSV